MNEAVILVIDDEPGIRKLLEITLESNGFRVELAATGKEGLLRAANHPPDLILLDIGLPDVNGHEVLQQLRGWYTKPVIILSVQNTEQDIVKALDTGANDYLCKPFRSGELLARIRTALRNSAEPQRTPLVQIGALTLDLAARVLSGPEGTVKLTSTEYELLSLMVKNEGRVLTHTYLLQQVWGPGYTEQTQYLRVFVTQLRKKIEPDPAHPKFLLTESGVGYRIRLD
ncbi:MAG: response regulator [Bacteroidota bacterium]